MIHLKPTETMKFLCSYGGKILPRFPDGILRYHGGHTRVLSVNRSISFAELMMKLEEMCGAKVSLRCQLPTEDLDALVSITSDEDLLNLIEEYDQAASLNLKIRALLSPSKPTKKVLVPFITTAIASSSSSSISSSGSVSKTLIPTLPPLPRPITSRQISGTGAGRTEKTPSHRSIRSRYKNHEEKNDDRKRVVHRRITRQRLAPYFPPNQPLNKPHTLNHHLELKGCI